MNTMRHDCNVNRLGILTPLSTGRSAAAIICLLAITVWITRPAGAQTTFHWITDSDGSWHTGSDWDLGSAPDGADHIVIIDRPGANPTVTFNAASGTRLVQSLTSQEKIVLSGGTLELVDTGQFNNTFNMTGGTLKGGAITASSGIDVNGSANNRIDAVTLSGNLDLTGSSHYVTIVNGLTLNGAANLTGNSSTLDFDGTQGLAASVGNTATVNLGYSNSQVA